MYMIFEAISRRESDFFFSLYICYSNFVAP